YHTGLYQRAPCHCSLSAGGGQRRQRLWSCCRPAAGGRSTHRHGQLTGGSDTGREVMRVASETVKKVSLELGGKSANIIFDDADLERALPFVISGIFTNAGQLCTVGSRLLVQDTIQARVIDEVRCRAERLRVGNGRDEATQMGPLVSEVQLQRVSGYVDIGKQE